MRELRCQVVLHTNCAHQLTERVPVPCVKAQQLSLQLPLHGSPFMQLSLA